MRSISDIYAGIDAERLAIESENESIRKAQERLDRSARRLERRRAKLSGRYYMIGVRATVDAIATELEPAFPNHRLEVSGPFGIPHNTYIFAYDAEDHAVAHLAFRMGGDRIELVDTDTDSGEYPRRSIGDMNGLNHPSAPVESIEQLRDLLKTKMEA